MSDHPLKSDGVPSQSTHRDALPVGTPPDAAAPARPVEIGGRGPKASRGLDPTRFGDWEKDGRCIDF